MQKIIGVFDSGAGGRTTLKEIQTLLPGVQTIYFGDREHCPYGEKSQSELIEITSEIVAKMEQAGATMIVIACNTATTQCIRALRERFPRLTFVGTEPALKVACDHGCRNILLMATLSTVKSRQVERLVEDNITDQHLTLLPCAGLAELVEEAVVGEDACPLNAGLVAKLDELLLPLPERDKVDGVVLGCTHYIFLRPYIQRYFPNAELIDGNAGVARHVKELLESGE